MPHLAVSFSSGGKDNTNLILLAMHGDNMTCRFARDIPTVS
jgi:hypothetical protein